MRFSTKLGMGVAFAALAACGGGNNANNMAYENAAEMNAGRFTKQGILLQHRCCRHWRRRMIKGGELML